MEAADQAVVLRKGSVVGKGSCRLLRDAVSITDKEEKIRVVEENAPTSFKDFMIACDENLEILAEEITTGNREIKIHVYGIRQTSVENFSE